MDGLLGKEFLPSLTHIFIIEILKGGANAPPFE
jgi:hypothetical protein